MRKKKGKLNGFAKPVYVQNNIAVISELVIKFLFFERSGQEFFKMQEALVKK
jgi:hypothetical protein